MDLLSLLACNHTKMFFWMPGFRLSHIIDLMWGLRGEIQGLVSQDRSNEYTSRVSPAFKTSMSLLEPIITKNLLGRLQGKRPGKTCL